MYLSDERIEALKGIGDLAKRDHGHLLLLLPHHEESEELDQAPHAPYERWASQHHQLLAASEVDRQRGQLVTNLCWTRLLIDAAAVCVCREASGEV